MEEIITMEAAMKSYTKEERQEHMENWRKGTLSKAAYAKSAGIVETTFYNWTKKLRKKKQGFIEIQQGNISGGIPEITIEKGNITIRVPLSAGSEGIGTVLNALGDSK